MLVQSTTFSGCVCVCVCFDVPLQQDISPPPRCHYSPPLPDLCRWVIVFVLSSCVAGNCASRHKSPERRAKTEFRPLRAVCTPRRWGSALVAAWKNYGQSSGTIWENGHRRCSVMFIQAEVDYVFCQSINNTVDRPIDWLFDWLFVWLTDWLIDWSIDWSIDWVLTDR